MKILFAGLRYDYGVLGRGPSLESKTFVPAIREVADTSSVFWFEENGFPNDLEFLQENLIKHADDFNPDLIFFLLMDSEISMTTLEYLTKRYITLNWFCDDTWRFNSFSKRVAPFLSYLVTNDKFSLNKYIEIGCKPILSQWATLDYNEQLDFNNISYQYDISFVGSKNPAREWIIEELKRQGLMVHCFGSGWDNGRVGFEEMKQIFYITKINLNLSNSVPTNIGFLKYSVINLLKAFIMIFKSRFIKYLKNIYIHLKSIKFFFYASKTAEQVKARNFEIAGWGGFQLTQYALELEDYYEIGKEIAIFTSPNELIAQCRFYLENEEIRKTMCKKGHERTKEYNYVDRLRMLIKRIE
jgi:spore maturation protein CgeB